MKLKPKLKIHLQGVAMKHYFLTIFLPELKWGNPIGIQLEELMQLYEAHLQPKDYASVLWMKEYLFKDLSHINELTTFNCEGLQDLFIEIEDEFNLPWSEQHKFIKMFCEFEHKLKLFLVTLRAIKLGREPSKETCFNRDLNQPEESLIIASTHSSHEDEFQVVGKIFESSYERPAELQQELLKFEYDAVKRMMDEYQDFSIEHLFGYFIQFNLHQKNMLINTKSFAPVEALLKELT